MEFQPNAVSADILNNGVTVLPGVSVDGMGNISQMAPGLCGPKPQFDTLPCHLHKLCGAGRHLSDREHAGRVRIISIQYCGYIHIQNIALLQNLVFAGNTVADDVI